VRPVDFVLASQRASGAFRSVVFTGGATYDDENAFITALVSLELASLPFDPRIDDALDRACDFLLGCRHERGGFGFYPLGGEPAWIGGRIASDADDTALCTMLLLARGRIDHAEALQISAVLDPFRVYFRPESADPWVQRGAQRTWLDAKTWPNPIDVCVNANVAALLAQLGCRGEAYDAAWRTVSNGVDWFLRSPALRPHLTPFYPEAFELRDAIRRAIGAGVDELAGSFERIEPHAGPAGETAPICSSHDGAFRWFAPALQAARRLVAMRHERKTDDSQRREELLSETEATHRRA
jgi:hypothetical protein